MFQVGRQQRQCLAERTYEPELAITEQLINDLSNRRRGVVDLSHPRPVLLTRPTNLSIC